MKQYGLGKSHKLCAKIAIDHLFDHREGSVETGGALAYPLRAVWAANPQRTRGERVQFLISVPKKRLHHAVDRVAMRRRIREAYRLNRIALVPQSELSPENVAIDVAFIYVANSLEPYARVEKAMQKLLQRIF